MEWDRVLELVKVVDRTSTFKDSEPHRDLLVLRYARKGHRAKRVVQDPEKNNKKKSKIRCRLVHPFANMKEKLDYRKAVAKTLERAALRPEPYCIILGSINHCTAHDQGECAPYLGEKV